MMRIYLFTLMVLFFFGTKAQSLEDIYKTGTFTLTPDPEFAKGTDWEKIFPDYNLVSYGNPIGRYKSIAVAPDGSVFVGNYNTYTIQKFDANGSLVKTFGKKGRGEADFKHRPTLGGVVSGKYVFTHELNGHIKLFSLNGEFVRNIVLDYLPLKTIALKSNNIAVVGHVPLGEAGGVRHVVTLIDPETGATNVIKQFDDVLNRTKSLTINRDGYLYSFSPSVSRVNTIIRALPNGNLLVGVSNSSRIEIYNPNGRLVEEFNLDFKNLPYPEDLKKEFTSNLEKLVSDDKAKKTDIAPVYEKDFFPENMPLYYNIIIDPKGNLLVLKFVEEDVDHMFRAYSFNSKGESIGDASLEIPNFNAVLNYRFEELVFHKEAVIGLLQPKADKSSPAQLLKLKYK